MTPEEQVVRMWIENSKAINDSALSFIEEGNQTLADSLGELFKPEEVSSEEADDVTGELDSDPSLISGGGDGI